MTFEELLAEGRHIQRPTVLLTPEGSGDVAAMWYGRDYARKSSDGHRCWLAIDTRFIPSFSEHGWLAIFTNDKTFQGGRVEVLSAPPTKEGIPLLSKEIELLPPIDAVMARGSPTVDHWLAENGWQRDWGYNRNFRDRALVEKYEAVERRENPFFWKDSLAYASLGGWHMAWPDGDWNELLEATLLVQTYAESEPWIEVWKLPSGQFKVVQRIT